MKSSSCVASMRSLLRPRADAAIASMLIRHGTAVTLMSRNETRLHEQANTLMKKLNGQAYRSGALLLWPERFAASRVGFHSGCANQVQAIGNCWKHRLHGESN